MTPTRFFTYALVIGGLSVLQVAGALWHPIRMPGGLLVTLGLVIWFGWLVRSGRAAASPLRAVRPASAPSEPEAAAGGDRRIVSVTITSRDGRVRHARMDMTSGQVEGDQDLIRVAADGTIHAG